MLSFLRRKIQRENTALLQKERSLSAACAAKDDEIRDMKRRWEVLLDENKQFKQSSEELEQKFTASAHHLSFIFVPVSL